MSDHDRPGTDVEPHVIVLFGATGDLASRSLFPALFRLHQKGLLPAERRILGTGRESKDLDEFRRHVADALREAHPDASAGDIDEFVADVHYAPGDSDDTSELRAAVEDAEREFGADARRLVYLSLPSAVMPPMIEQLDRDDLTTRARLIVEKPFGHDRESAGQLFSTIGKVFAEPDVYRIDHFLGKQSLHDLLALRATTALLEPLWRRQHVESVQIDVPEEIDVEGRGSFMEETGTFRDMISSHLLQTLGMVAAELPARIDGDALRAARGAVFADLRPFDPAEVVFGQYRGYRDEDDVADDSDVETFVALRAWVDSDRWSDVPFLLRTGKTMATSDWAVTVRLRDQDAHPFGELPAGGNEIVVSLSDVPNVTFSVRGLAAGPGFTIRVADAATTDDGTDADDGSGARRASMSAYERLLHDAMRGDRTLFVGADEAERLWTVCAPVLEHPPHVDQYDRGSWGPQAAVELAGPRGWRLQQEHPDAG